MRGGRDIRVGVRARALGLLVGRGSGNPQGRASLFVRGILHSYHSLEIRSYERFIKRALRYHWTHISWLQRSGILENSFFTSAFNIYLIVFSLFSHLWKKLYCARHLRPSVTTRFRRRENALSVTHCNEYWVIFFQYLRNPNINGQWVH
jgi:hypothetical protein